MNNLKGRQLQERMRELMIGQTNIKPDVNKSVFEFTKRADDGNVFAIVRENHEYYIKVSRTPDKPTKESFDYIGGLKNKKDFSYPSYAKALKHLNMKFSSISESIGGKNSQNMFINENILVEEEDVDTDESETDEVVDEANEVIDSILSESRGVDLKVSDRMSILSELNKIDAENKLLGIVSKFSADEIEELLETVKTVKKKVLTKN